MKNITVVIILAFAMLSCTQTKIAYVDVEELMKEYKGTKDAEEEMKIKSEKLKAELDSLVSNWENKAREYQQKAQRMSAKNRAEREQVLMQEQQAIGQRQQIIQQQVQSEGQESIKTISTVIKDFIKKYASEKGYTMVLGTSGDPGTVMYAEETTDLTDDILVLLNKEYKTKSD